MLVGGLVALACVERRAATGHPIRLPKLPSIDVPLPLRGRAVLLGQAVILAVSLLIITLDLAVLELLH